MNSIVLFIENDQWQPRQWVAQNPESVVEGDRLILELFDSWISIIKYDDLLKDYDEKEIEIINALVSDPTSYLIEWRGDDLLRKFNDEFPCSCNAVVDNDHGMVCKISDFKVF